MNILGFNIQISRTQPPVSQTKAFSVTPEEWLRGEDVGGAMLSSAYEQVVWVYRAINALAEQVANVPFLFSAGERGRENLITSGPLLDFYARPHPHLNRFQYWELRIIWLMLRGECFRVPIYEDAASLSAGEHPGSAFARSGLHPAPRAPRRALRQVLILDPARFQHIVEDHQLIGWRYTGFGPGAPLASQVFLPEEVWFERLPNPFNFWRGMPPLQVAGLAAQTDFAAGSFMRGVIENNGDTGVMVRTDKWLGDEQRAQIVATLRERKRRAGQADRPVLLCGSAEIVKPELSSSDLQFLENRKFSRAEICAAFGVPEEIVTTTDHSKYDVMSGARLNFIENRVAPLCSRLEAGEDIVVKSIDPSASGWFDLDSLPILQEARRNRLAAARTGFELGIPFNELNRVLDLGFKPLPWGDRGYLGANLRELGAMSNSSGACAGKGEIDPGKESDGRVSPAVRAVELLRAAEEREAQEPEPPLDPLAARKLRRFFFEQRGRVLAALQSADLAALQVGKLLDVQAEQEQLRAWLAPVLGGEGSAEAMPDLERAQALLATHFAALEGQIIEALAASETREQISARVRALYNQQT